ncbi:sigma-70 family RNA polymerase sigma factor [Enterococcus faecium]|uniref:RNA polymerase sigma factor n=1 Tax=Enterococcus faecium TaxID=1352 RepID=UPI00100E855C|nr:sigma-70 family RNA polymerase sigma factor [Enterococcus faecium]MCE3182612.1 sigma-70 family RNA polymerase sigma factor [Enterococcus faecium]MCW8789461.1 sigma-70 family RNA polymerase sigma factor [Enterococcus faecium]MCW8792255.1 sigma-70 family RNA polymerase sigma factor [Enterococcus faecium]MDV7721764.1 sigma-70 family RNA polymerase sigma factor [Enterococcus faecium]MDV7726824.1 sigma-70 family RNA polymerase sigma factor [Enterococcus faecium]
MKDLLDFRVVQIFDSFCKTVIRNEARNIKKQYARLRERQISLTELTESALASFQINDTSMENSEVFLALGMELLVANLDVAEAIHQLYEPKRKIILLYYFAGFNDREIGEIIGMSVGGVWYQRRKAEEELRKYLEENSHE